MVSVDAAGEYKDNYEGTHSSQWSGASQGVWDWSSRFIVAYTGSGVQTLGGQAMQELEFGSFSHYVVLLNPYPPSTQLRKKPYDCPASHHTANSGDSRYKSIAAGSLVAAARNVGGYARALVVSTLAGIKFQCPALAGEEPGEKIGNTDLNGPSLYALRAPSTDDFLGGKSFGRGCWQQFEADLPNPFPHHYSYSTTVAVQFTYFPRDELGDKERALKGLEEKEVKTESAASDTAREGLDHQQGNGAGCR